MAVALEAPLSAAVLIAGILTLSGCVAAPRSMRPTLRSAEHAIMSVIHVSYLHERYDSTADCVDGIRKRIQLGWQVSQVRGPRSGPFVVLFRIDDDESAWEAEPESAVAVAAGG